jgi:hypothetical protein
MYVVLAPCYYSVYTQVAALCSKLYHLKDRNVPDLTVLLEKGGNKKADVKEMIHGLILKGFATSILINVHGCMQRHSNPFGKHMFSLE